MLFNSHLFIFLFLPITLAGYAALRRAKRPRWTEAWLLATSLFFYGYWSVPFLGLLLGSIAVNYGLGQAISAARAPAPGRARALLYLGVIANLGLLGFYKYAGFIGEVAEDVSGLEMAVRSFGLPLAISFYTFQQIAFLVDCRDRPQSSYSLLDYALFVSFFPQLIAGPIVHHADLTPQLQHRARHGPSAEDVSAGLTFFVIGLAKKVLIADSLAGLADEVFDPAYGRPSFVSSWMAVSAFGLGLYFDFSGYSDMAVGLARLFGVRLPYNFNSPYRAASIIDFWRRWHITLSAFLRDYLYVRLGGNRLGPARRYANLMITMLLGGLWHGAAWTFVIWGGLHGLYLLLNHAWNALAAPRGWRIGRIPSRALTLLAVMAAWVFFRAPTPGRALEMLGGMAGFNELIGAARQEAIAQSVIVQGFNRLGEPIIIVDALNQSVVYATLVIAALIALFAPNSQEIVDGRGGERLKGALDRVLVWRPNTAWAAACAALFLFTLTLMGDIKEFAYFQF